MSIQESAVPPPKANIVSVISQGRRSGGLLVALDYGGWYEDSNVPRPNLYLLATYHSVEGDMTPQVLVHSVNGVEGKNVILTFKVIGIERSSDVIVGLYDSTYGSNDNFMLDYDYYAASLNWSRLTPVFTGDYVVAVGESSVFGSRVITYGQVKNAEYPGHGDNVLVRCRLLSISSLEGASGSPVFRQSDGEFIGMINARFISDDTYSISAAIDSDLLSFIAEYMIRTWWSGPGMTPAANDIYEVSASIKRGFEKTYLGIIHELVSIESLADYPTLDALWRVEGATYGGILVNGFIHGYDTIKKEYITEPNHPFIATDIKTYSVLHGTNMYNLFYTTKHPIVIKSITYQKWNILDPQASGTEVTQELGEFDSQVGLSDFFFYGEWEPFSMQYYYLQNSSQWILVEESFVPRDVVYRTEDGNQLIQLNVGFPYPMYGIEEVGSIQFLSSKRRARRLQKIGGTFRWVDVVETSSR